MKTYEQEYEELGNWITKKNEEYIEAVKKETAKGYDGELVYERRLVVEEYNRRLVALKIKYNKELSEQEQKWR